MTFWYLLIVGIMLLGNHMGLLGVVSLVFAFLASRSSERVWALILGIILVLTPGWFLAGLIGIVLYLVSDKNR